MPCLTGRLGRAAMSLKGKLYLLLALIAIGVLIGLQNPQPGP